MFQERPGQQKEGARDRGLWEEEVVPHFIQESREKQVFCFFELFPGASYAQKVPGVIQQPIPCVFPPYFVVTNPSCVDREGSAFSFNAGYGVTSVLETAHNHFSLFIALANDNWFLFQRYQSREFDPRS